MKEQIQKAWEHPKTGLSRSCVEIVKDVDDKTLKKVGINKALR